VYCTEQSPPHIASESLCLQIVQPQVLLWGHEPLHLVLQSHDDSAPVPTATHSENKSFDRSVKHMQDCLWEISRHKMIHHQEYMFCRNIVTPLVKCFCKMVLWHSPGLKAGNQNCAHKTHYCVTNIEQGPYMCFAFINSARKRCLHSCCHTWHTKIGVSCGSIYLHTIQKP